jgi:hypothetical protein
MACFVVSDADLRLHIRELSWRKSSFGQLAVWDGVSIATLSLLMLIEPASRLLGSGKVKYGVSTERWVNARSPPDAETKPVSVTNAVDGLNHSYLLPSGSKI